MTVPTATDHASRDIDHIHSSAYFLKAFNAALLRCSGVAHSGGRFCAFVIFKSSLLYRSKRPSFFIWSSIA